MFEYILNGFGFSGFEGAVFGRCFAAFFIAMALSLVCGGKVSYVVLHHQLKGQPTREAGPQSQKK